MSNHIHTFCIAWLHQNQIQNNETKSDYDSEDEAENIDQELAITDDKSKLEKLAEEEDKSDVSDEDGENLDLKEEEEKEAENSDDEIIKRFNLDDYDNSSDEESNPLFSSLSIEKFNSHEMKDQARSLHIGNKINGNSSNKSALFNPDELIDKKSKNSKFNDEEDVENQEILPTDNLLIAGRADEDFNSLEVHVYNSKTGDFYCHHDIWIDQTALCMEIIKNEASTFCLIGMPDGSIEAWDLALSNVASADLKIEAHDDAVLSLKYFENKKDSEKSTYFISASVDKSVKVWKIPVVDLEKVDEESDDSADDGQVREVQTIKNFKSPIQTMAINKSQDKIIFGSMGGQIRLHRFEPNSKEAEFIPEKAKKKWNFTIPKNSTSKQNQIEEIEKVCFLGKNQEYIFAASNKGNINLFTEEHGLIYSQQIHTDAVPKIIEFADYSGLLTCSSDGTLKIWKLDFSPTAKPEEKIKLIKRKKFGTGAIHCMALNPDNHFALALGGEKGGVQVWNMRKDLDLQKAFPVAFTDPENNNVVEEFIPEKTVDLDGGVGDEDEKNYFDNIIDDYLPTTKKPKKS